MVAQDIHFTQFYTQAQSLNPGLTGWYDGDIRVNAIYRTQWKAIDGKDYRTIGFGLEKQYHQYSNMYSFGIQAISDETGYVGLASNKIDISGSFSTKYLGNRISGGIQVGGVYKSTNILQYSYDDQYELGGTDVFNTDLPTAEIEGDPVSYLNINAGVVWSKKFTKKIHPEAGIAFYHINTPNESFYGAEYAGTELASRAIVHIGGKYSANKRIHIEPKILYMRQLKATDFILGGNAIFNFTKDLALYGGMLFRYSWHSNYDASAFVGGIQYKNFDIGMSYDVNISNLKTATNNRGAFEVSLVYITKSLQNNFIKIPCNRF